MPSHSQHTSSFGPTSTTSPTYFNPDPAFLYKNDVLPKDLGRTRISLVFDDESNVSTSTSTSPRTTSQFLQAIHSELVKCDAPLDVKELYESYEFFLRTRKRLFGAAKRRLSSPSSSIEVHDMCCGHGFTGMLFAACTPSLDVRVKLFDRTCPPSHAVIREAMERVCPHMKGRVEF
eukprot:CAMPEP_0118652230 /NCGR_PEP_ID=MMETSP0785-20121206/11206_1 /TAXON_ID=91992 /ORGANISM="Bolidomonas pacifica, Strain CCMP 1866" /LENGTH=175 /DNA_ID=CAMNT_0006544731 /DNA_START=42 /DNA_END=566 /DNA_ORIENTATION=+